MTWMEWINDVYTPNFGVWSKYIQAQGPLAMFVMLTLGACFVALFFGTLEFYRPDRD